MSDNLAEAFDAPVIETIGGEPVTFQRPTMEDFTTWANQLHAARKVSGTKLIYQHVKDSVERVNALMQLENVKPGLGDVANDTFNIAGTMKMLTLSLSKSNSDPAAVQAIISKIPPHSRTEIAQRVSGLFKPKDKVPDAPAGETPPDPNAP